MTEEERNPALRDRFGRPDLNIQVARFMERITSYRNRLDGECFTSQWGDLYEKAAGKRNHDQRSLNRCFSQPD